MTMPGARPIPDPEAEMHRLAAERKVSPHVRKVLDEAVTVVKPGETLIVRLPWGSVYAQQVVEYQRALDDIVKHRGLPFRVIVICADQIAVAEPA
jgi:hypothetical protein